LLFTSKKKVMRPYAAIDPRHISEQNKPKYEEGLYSVSLGVPNKSSL